MKAWIIFTIRTVSMVSLSLNCQAQGNSIYIGNAHIYLIGTSEKNPVLVMV